MKVLIHTNIIGSGSTMDPFRGTMLFPSPEEVTILVRSDVYCQRLDGTDSDLAARPMHGYVGELVANFGSIGVVRMHVDDDVWPRILSAYETHNMKFVYGFTLQELKDSATKRRDLLLASLASHAPTFAADLAQDLTTLPEKVRIFLQNQTPTNVAVESYRAWVVQRLSGNTLQAWPSGMFIPKSEDMRIGGVAAFWKEYASAAKADHARLIPVLWALARLTILVQRIA